jgi:hypothetical protein
MLEKEMKNNRVLDIIDIFYFSFTHNDIFLILLR